MATSPEALLISSVLRNRDYQLCVAAGIHHDMFHAFDEEWKWIERYWKKYQRTPSRTAFINHFPDFVIKNADDTDHFSDEVRKSHARSLLTGVMREATDYIADGNIDQATSYLVSSLNVVAAAIGAVQDTNIFADWEGVLEDAESRRDRFEQFGMSGIPTGFDTLDERSGGVGLGQSWIIGARLGERKSWTLMNMACAAVMGGFNVQYDALEQSRIEVSMRVHTILSGKVGKRIFEAQMLLQGKEPDMAAYREFLRGLKHQIKSNFIVSDRRGIGLTEIVAQVERNRPDIGFLDYLTLANSGGAGDWQDISKFSKGISTLAGDFQIGFVSAAQLNRGAAQGRDVAGTETLGLSDAIGQDADMVINTRKLSQRVSVYKVVKARHGDGDYKWYVHFDPGKGIFNEVSKQVADDLIDEDRVNAGDKE